MCKLGQLHAIFLAQQTLFVLSLSDVVNLYGLVARRRHEEFSIVIVVNGQDVRLLSAVFDVFSAKKLRLSAEGPQQQDDCSRLTFVARNVDTTSLRLDTDAVVPSDR